MKVIVFVDVQKDFIDGALRNEKAIEVTPKIVEFAKDCVKNGYKLYATRDTHKKTVHANIHKLDGTVNNDTPWNGYLASLEGQKLPVEHCIEGTDGWMIDYRLMEILVDGKCTFINKPTFGSFDLAEIILEDTEKTWEKVPYEKNYDIDEIVICGFCTDICVISNALILRAKFPNTKITIKSDLCAGVTVESHEAALTTAKMCQLDVE